MPHHPPLHVTPATPRDKPVVANLIQLYLYDMTDDLPFPIGPDGRYEYDHLNRFWQQPYLLHSGPDLAGFALVIEQCPITGRAPCFFMAEFFVLRPYRRSGLGRAAGTTILARHPGAWHIGTIARNVRAAAFWANILADRGPDPERLEFDGESWLLHAFTQG